MKKNLLKSTLWTAGLLAFAIAAHAETLRVHIPFEFTADRTTLPAGEYSIRSLPGSPTVLVLEATGNGSRAMVFVRAVNGTFSSPSPISFVGEGTAQPALATVVTAGQSYELSTPPSSRSLTRSTALAITSGTIK